MAINTEGIYMLTMNEIIELLQDRHLPTVAQKTQVSYRTIYNIKNGKNRNPSILVVEALSKYFKRNP